MMKYFHAVWSLDGNRYSVLSIDYINKSVDLVFNNSQVPFSEVKLIEVTEEEWLNSTELVEHSNKVDGDLRKDIIWHDDGEHITRRINI